MVLPHGWGDPWGDLPVGPDSHVWVGFVWILFPVSGKPGWENPYPCPWMGNGGEIPGNPGLEELGVGDPWGSLPGGNLGG